MGIGSWLPLGTRTFVYRGWVSAHTPPRVSIFSSIPCSLYELRWVIYLFPCSFSALKGVSLAPSSHTQGWVDGKVGEHRKDALGVKADPEDRAEPKEAQPEAHRSPEADSFRWCFWCWALYWIFFIFSQFGGFGLLFFFYHHNCSSAGLSAPSRLTQTRRLSLCVCAPHYHRSKHTSTFIFHFSKMPPLWVIMGKEGKPQPRKEWDHSS